MSINAGAIIEAVAWFYGACSLLMVVGMCVGIWADRKFDEYGRNRQ